MLGRSCCHQSHMGIATMVPLMNCAHLPILLPQNTEPSFDRLQIKSQIGLEILIRMTEFISQFFFMFYPEGMFECILAETAREMNHGPVPRGKSALGRIMSSLEKNIVAWDVCLVGEQGEGCLSESLPLNKTKMWELLNGTEGFLLHLHGPVFWNPSSIYVIITTTSRISEIWKNKYDGILGNMKNVGGSFKFISIA